MAPIRILHLSDLHVEAGSDATTLLQPLAQDLCDKDEGLGVEHLDYLVVSGDLTNRATPEEFIAAREFLAKLIARFELTAQRVMIVPGNHDQAWDPTPYDFKPARQFDPARHEAGRFVSSTGGYLVRDDARYAQRFEAFSSKLYEPLIGAPYPLEAAKQGVAMLSGDGRLQFLAFNSSWLIDEHFKARSALHDGAISHTLDAADAQVRDARKEGRIPDGARPLRMAVWHHPVTGNERIADDAFLERLRQADVRMCLHGHVHEVRVDIVGYTHPTRRIHVVGAGSFGAPAKDRPEATPALYNLLELDPSLRRATVHTRGRSKRGGAFSGYPIWPGADRHSKRTFYELDLGDHGWPNEGASGAPGGTPTTGSTPAPPVSTAPPSRVAYEDDAMRLPRWMFDLDRRQQKEATQKFDAAATAMVIVGPDGAGHRFVSLWGRLGYQDRGPIVRVVWPSNRSGVGSTRLHVLITRLAHAFELRERLRELEDPASPMLREELLSRGAWPGFLSRLHADLEGAMFPNLSAAKGALTLVRHEALQPRPEDAQVLDEYLRHVWVPLAERVHERRGRKLRGVLAFEFYCDGKKRHKDLHAAAAKHGANPSQMEVPRIEALAPVTQQEVLTWLLGDGDRLRMLLGRMSREERRFVTAISEDAPDIAAQIIERTGGTYDKIINLFRGD